MKTTLKIIIMPLSNVFAFYCQNNAYDSIVIPQTDTCIINPSKQIIADFYAVDADFADWSGTSITDQLLPTSVDNLTDSDIAELFGDIIHSRYC